MITSYQEAKQLIHSKTMEIAERVFQRDKHNSGFVCPVCKNGTGKSGRGMVLNKNGYTFTCYSGRSKECPKSRDIIDIYGGMMCGRKNFNDKINECLSVLGEEYRPSSGYGGQNARMDKIPQQETAPSTPKENYSDYYQKVQASIELLSAGQMRGLSMDTLKSYGIGYDPNWKHPSQANNPNITPSPHLIIPISDSYYIARRLQDSPSMEDTSSRYYIIGGDSKSYFGINSLYDAKVGETVYIVEGAIDAMSFHEIGAKAVAIGSTSNADAFARFISNNSDSQKIKCGIIFAFDNDPPSKEGIRAGEKAQISSCNILSKSHPELDFPFMAVDTNALYCGYKDANEALIHARENFASNVRSQISPAMSYLSGENSSHACKERFLQNRKGKRPIPTGFLGFDNALDGGLRAGLYVLGGISSLGKTSFLWQMANQIASKGFYCYFYSLEQSTDELVAKSISRLSYIFDSTKGRIHAKPLSVLMDDIEFQGEDLKIYNKCLECLSDPSYNIHMQTIHEDFGSIKAERIKDDIKRHIDYTGQIPVVIIDYLQIIAPVDEKLTDKQIIDKNVSTLKLISAKYGVPIIVVSSLNRMNYTNDINMGSFKESGSIEYTADVLLGLQFRDFEQKYDVVKNDKEPITRQQFIDLLKKQPIREAELVILKARTNLCGQRIPLDFIPKYNVFVETLDETFQREPQIQQPSAVSLTSCPPSISTKDFAPARQDSSPTPMPSPTYSKKTSLEEALF